MDSLPGRPADLRNTVVDRLYSFLFWFCAAWAAFGAVRTFLAAQTSIAFKYAHNYTEPVVAALTLNIPRNPLLYAGFDREPYLINPYNPLYLYLSHIVRVMTDRPILTAGRSVTFAAALTVTALIALFLKKLDIPAKAWILASALFVQLPAVASELASMRPDMTGLALSLAGLLLVLIDEHRRSSGNRRGSNAVQWGAVACFALAYFTKQNFVSAPAAYFAMLLTERRWRPAFVFGVRMTLVLTLPTLAWDLWTSGNYHLNQAMSVKKAFYPELILRYWKEFVSVYFMFTAAAIAAGLLSVRDRRYRLIFFYAVLAAASTVALGKIGSDWNYFLEFFAAGSVMTGLLLGRLGAGGSPAARRFAAAALAAVLCLQFAPDPVKMWRGPAVGEVRTIPEYDRLVEVIRKIQGPVLSENMGILIAADKPVLFEPYGFAQLAYAGLWDESKILDRIDRQEFPLIVLESNLWHINRSSRFTPGFVEHLRRHYRPAGTAAGLILCVPASEDAAVRP